MRITGRELRRVINEEVRRSMKLNLREDAESTISEKLPAPEYDSLKSRLKNLITSDDKLKAETGNVLHAIGNIWVNGKESVYAKAIISSLNNPQIVVQEPYEKTLSFIAALQTGKPVSGYKADPTYFKKTLNYKDTLFDSKFEDALQDNAVIDDIIKFANHTVTIGEKEAAAELVTKVAKNTVAASVANADHAKNIAADAAAAAAPAAKVSPWVAYDADPKNSGVHAAWTKFVKSGSSIAKTGNDGGNPYTWKFSDFGKFYKKELTKAKVLEPGKTSIIPKEMIVLLTDYTD